MQEEISLRDIIEVLLGGKKIIILTTILAVLIFGIFSFFVLAPSYQAAALVRLVNSGDEKVDKNINSFTESVKSEVTINRIIQKLELDKKLYSINSLRNSIKIETLKDTNVVSIKAIGSDPQTITKIANLLAFELGTRIEISDRSIIIVNSKNRLLEVDETISITQSEINEAKGQLETTPEVLVTKKSLADDPYLQSVLADSAKTANKDLGAIQLTSETINPIYTSLKLKISEESVNLSKLREEKNVLNKKITENQQMIDQLEKQVDNEKLLSSNSQRLLNGLKAVFITPSLEPSEPIGPRKLLNLALSGVIGVILGCFIVFFEYYWRKSDQANNKNSGLSV